MLVKRIYQKLNKDIKKMAIVIGIGYTNTPIEMSDPYDDIYRFIAYLFSIGFENDDIIILTDSKEFNNSALPTHINIITYINDIVKSANENTLTDSYVVFYYTGHGTRMIHNNQLVEAIIPLNFDEAQCITGDILKQLLVNRLNKNVTLFCMFDCCYSGNIINLKYTYIKNKQYVNTISDKSECNVFVLGSSKNNQISLKTLIDLGKKNYEKRSLLTWAFYDKFKMNSTLSGLISNIQQLIDIKFKDAQTIQLSSNKNIDHNIVSIPELTFKKIDI